MKVGDLVVLPVNAPVDGYTVTPYCSEDVLAVVVEANPKKHSDWVKVLSQKDSKIYVFHADCLDSTNESR